MLLLASLYAMLRGTFLGRAIRACSANRDSAALVGIDVERTMSQMFAIGAATTAFAGASLSVLYQFVPDSHYVWIGRILCVVILGGLGSFAGRRPRRRHPRPRRGLHRVLLRHPVGDRRPLRPHHR